MTDPQVYWTFIIPALALIIVISIIVFIIIRRRKKQDTRQKNLEQYYPAKTMEVNLRNAEPSPDPNPDLSPDLVIQSKGSEENV